MPINQSTYARNYRTVEKYFMQLEFSAYTRKHFHRLRPLYRSSEYIM